MKYWPQKHSIFLLLVLLASFITVNFGIYSCRQSFIDGDGHGYYAYLPAVFIYHTVDFKEFTSQTPQVDDNYHQPHYFFPYNDILVNKYTCGTALLNAPLFLAALGITALSGIEPDGYSVMFQFAVGLSALAYLFLGLLLLKKLLESYSIPGKSSIFIAVIGFFATNLFFYSFIQPSLSHVYSFFAITSFLYFTRKVLLTYHSRDLFIASLAFGLVVLIRPVNGLSILAVPFLAGAPLPQGVRSNNNLTLWDALMAAFLFLLAVSPQWIILLVQTGTPFLWLYPGEGFNFNQPHLIDFLFSYKKGWFVYTPFMLLLIPGLYMLWRRTRYEFISYLCVLLFTIYLFSSWWNWFYGDGFGMRTMVDFYGLFLIPIGLLINQANKTGKILIFAFIILTAGLNIIQSYQYSKGILHADSMNKSAYWFTFLRTVSDYKDVVGPAEEIVYGKRSDEPVISAFNDFEKEVQGWIKLKQPDSGQAFSGSHYLILDSTAVYSYGYPLPVNQTLKGRNDLYVNFSVHYLEPTENAAAGALFIADILNSQNQSVYYRNFKLKSLHDRVTGQWRAAETGFRLPRLYEDATQVRFYIWNKEKRQFLIDDMGIEIYAITIY